ncbi:MAG: phenol hydroxylase subunit [Rhodoferax sp.]|nr:phenol hydroxylase subunit [Rhodoferax sp.]
MTMTKTLTSPTAPTCDIKRQFVRIRQVRPDGLVCFEFAIGWPELFVELMLPQPAFDDFCVQNQVQILKT